jgi:hypothetical protein
MRFVKVKDEERTGDVAINLDTLEEGCCTSISSGAPPPRTTSPLQVRMHKKYGQPWASADCERNETGKIQCQSSIAAYGRNLIYRARQV